MPRPALDLIALARGGDAAALASLLAVAQPNIRRYARVACTAADIDDAVQDALCVLHRHVGNLRTVDAFWGWMFQVVKRECIRLAKRAINGTPIDAIDDDVRFATRPEHELRIDLAHAIEALPLHYREVLVLRDIEELTIDEITARLTSTRGTVKAQLHRARALVREYLEA